MFNNWKYMANQIDAMVICKDMKKSSWCAIQTYFVNWEIQV